MSFTILNASNRTIAISIDNNMKFFLKSNEQTTVSKEQGSANIHLELLYESKCKRGYSIIRKISSDVSLIADILFSFKDDKFTLERLYFTHSPQNWKSVWAASHYSVQNLDKLVKKYKRNSFWSGQAFFIGAAVIFLILDLVLSGDMFVACMFVLVGLMIGIFEARHAGKSLRKTCDSIAASNYFEFDRTLYGNEIEQD